MSKSIQHPVRLFLRVAAILGLPAGIFSLGDSHMVVFSVAYAFFLAWVGVGFALAVESRIAFRLWLAAAVLGMLGVVVAAIRVANLASGLDAPLSMHSLRTASVLIMVSLATLFLLLLAGWCQWLRARFLSSNSRAGTP